MSAPPTVPATIGIHTSDVVCTGANDGVCVGVRVSDGEEITLGEAVAVPVSVCVGLVEALGDAVGSDVIDGEPDPLIDGLVVIDGV